MCVGGVGVCMQYAFTINIAVAAVAVVTADNSNNNTTVVSRMDGWFQCGFQSIQSREKREREKEKLINIIVLCDF